MHFLLLKRTRKMRCNAKINPKSNHNLFLGRHHQRLVLPVEDNVLSPEHDITVDLEIGTAVGLHTTEACVCVDLGEGDGVTGDHGGVGRTHCYAEVGQLGVAGVGEAAYLGVVGCALDFCVVGVGDLRVDEEEGGTGVWYMSVI